MRFGGTSSAPESDPSREGKRPCWKCGTWYGPDVVMCVKCGVNLDAGRELRAESDEPARRLSAPLRFLVFVGDWMPGLFVPKTG